MEETRPEPTYELTKLKQPPAARLSVEQAASVLGFTPTEIGVLVARGVLKPLGKPKPNGHKYFAWQAIIRLALDERWLEKATQKVSENWVRKNGRNKPLQGDASFSQLT